jgi:hypothetical protein
MNGDSACWNRCGCRVGNFRFGSEAVTACFAGPMASGARRKRSVKGVLAA